MKKQYFVVGAKWFDKVNGNTYCNAKIIDTNGVVFYIGYQYGYGSFYLQEAIKKVKEKDPDAIGVTDCGCFYIKKRDLQNNNF